VSDWAVCAFQRQRRDCPLKGCDDGPGPAVALDAFAEYVKARGQDAGDFRKICGLGKDAPRALTFFETAGFSRVIDAW